MTRILATYSQNLPNESLDNFARIIHAKIIPWKKITPAAGLEILPLAVWDYSLYTAQFLAWLDELERVGAQVINPPQLIRWNINKRYLVDLAAKLPFITPSKVIDSPEKALLCGWENPVIKPLIGQGGNGVQRFQDGTPLFCAEGYLVQPFISFVGGEICLIYLNGTFSHAVMRVLAANEWRANSRFRAVPQMFVPQSQLLEIGAAVIEALPQNPFYARIDILPAENQQFFVNEVELIEPALYPHLAPNFAEKFLSNLNKRF